MTLNITIVSLSGIHQSADLQVSKTDKDADGNWIELQPNSSKIVSLSYEKWSGLLTYCGIGLWKGKRTDEYAAEWLADLSKSGATFQDAVEKSSRARKRLVSEHQPELWKSNVSQYHASRV